MVSIPVVHALSSVSDSFNNSSKVSGTYQTVVTGGHVELAKYNTSLGLTGFGSCRKITIDHTKIDTVLTDFPILVYLNSSNIDWSKVQDDLDDLRFTQDNSTLLMAELDNSVTNSEAWIWVKIPSVSNTSDTFLFMYYNNPSASSYWNPESVWDSNYVMVQHMKDATTSTILDSTSNNNDGTKKGANEPLETASGKIDGAQSFDFINDYVQLSNSNSLKIVGNITIMVWIKPTLNDGSATNRIILAKYRSDNTQLSYVYYMFCSATGTMRVRLSSDGTTSTYADSASVIPLDSLSFVTMVYDGSHIINYVNGIVSGTPVDFSGSLFDSTSNPTIGAWSNLAEYFNGVMDEIHVSNIARSAAWIKAEYYAEIKQLQSYGNEENPHLVYYGNGLLYSINLLLATSSSKIDSFIYNATITNPGTVKIQFSENNATWQDQYGTSNAWTSLATGQHTLDMFNLEWSNHFYYRINMTQTSSTVSPYLNEISVYYLADSTPTGTIQAIFSELFYGSGSWLGLLILLIFIVALSLAQQYLGLLMLPVAIYLAIEYLSYPALMWNALIMFLASIFIVINLVRGRND